MSKYQVEAESLGLGANKSSSSKYEKDYSSIFQTPQLREQEEMEAFHKLNVPTFEQKVTESEQSDFAQMDQAQQDYGRIIAQQNADEQTLIDQRQMEEQQQAFADMPKLEPTSTKRPEYKNSYINSFLNAMDIVSRDPGVKAVGDIGRELYVPGAGAANVASYATGVGAGVSKLLPRLGNSPPGRVASGAIQGAAVEAPLAAGQALTSQTNQLDEAAVQGAVGGAVGAGLGAVGPILGRGLKSGLDRLRASKIETPTVQLEPSMPANPINVDPPPLRATGRLSNIGNSLSVSRIKPQEPTNLDDLVRFHGHTEVNPETVAKSYNTKTWYHGTGTDKLTADSLDPFVGSHESLFGQGVYLTDNPKIAEGYAKSRGKRGVPTIYEANVDVDRVLDLEKSITPDVHAAVNKTVKGLDYQYNLHFEEPNHFTNLVAEEVRKGASVEQIIQKIRNEVGDFSHEAEIPTSEFVENFQELAINLKESGYDAITHTGGGRTGNEAHRVMIMLDPQNVYGAERANKNVTRFETRKQPDKTKIAAAAERLGQSLLRVEPVQNSLRITPEPQTIDDVLTVKEPRIRDRVYNYLDEAEKAARGRIASRKNRISSTPLDQYADYAIIGAAKIGKGTIKLADFTEEMVKEFGEGIRPKIRQVYNQSMREFKEIERRQSKEAQEAKAFNAADEGDADTFSGKISRDVSDKGIPFSQRVEKLRTQFTDDIVALEGLEKNVRGKVESAEKSLYKSGRLFRGMPAKANQVITERLTPIVEQVEKAGFTSKQLGDYALAVHAEDVNARDIKSGFTNREIAAVKQKYGTPEMEAARKALVKVGDDMLKELSDAGVISNDLFKTLKERYPNYIPLFRSFDDEKVEFGRGLSNALANVTAPIKKLKGSERQVIDPLENMVRNIYQSTSAAERNKVSSQLSRLAKEDTEGKFIRKLGPGEEVGRKNVVTVLENGEKVGYEVEPEVYKALLNLDQESSNMLIKVLQAPASVLRAGATLTPEFSFRNPMRDVLQAFVTSKSGFNPIVDFPVGIIQAISKGDLYKRWVNDLGDYGNIVSMDRDAHKEALQKVLGEPIGKKFVNVISGKQLIGLLRKIADISESGTKVGEYRAALRQGQTPQEAAYRSRDLMDFARAGTGIRQANKVVAFLNANIQGKSKLLRAIRENPVGVSARAFAAVTLPTVGVFAFQKKFSNEEQKRIIDDAPAWMTDSFWLIPVPGTDQVARIPKPFDLAAIFSNAPERALKYVYNNDREAFDKFVSKSLADMALPAQISGLLPFIEGMANYSFFRQGDIIPLGEQGRNYEDQYDINTTETAKGLSFLANKATGGEGALKNFSSPRIMDNTIKGLTAGLGTYATSAIDVLLDASGLTNNPDKPTKDAAQRPLAKAFLVNPLQSGKATDKLYSRKGELSKEKSSAKLNGITLDPLKDKELKSITKQTDSMSDLTKKIRATEQDRNLSPQEKRRLIDEYTHKRNQIAADAAKNLQKR